MNTNPPSIHEILTPADTSAVLKEIEQRLIELERKLAEMDNLIYRRLTPQSKPGKYLINGILPNP